MLRHTLGAGLPVIHNREKAFKHFQAVNVKTIQALRINSSAACMDAMMLPPPPLPATEHGQH